LRNLGLIGGVVRNTTVVAALNGSPDEVVRAAEYAATGGSCPVVEWQSNGLDGREFLDQAQTTVTGNIHEREH
jgi:hypothetical protein